MKKLTIITALSLMFTMFLQAQITPKIGMTFSKNNGMEQDFLDYPDAKTPFKPGYSIGVGYDIQISEAISLQPNLQYIQKGAKLTLIDEVAEFKLSESINLNYLEMPVLIKFGLGSAKTFFLYGGPSIGYWLNGNFTISFEDTSTGDSDTLSEKIIFDEDTNRTEFSLQLGMGYLIANKILLDVKYGIGLSDISSFGDTASKNRVLQLSIGMPFNL